MAQIIKNRRGSIGNVKDVTTQNGEIIVASGSIGDLSGPFILYGSPTPSDNGLAGVYKPASKIYQGANVPTISVGTYGNVLDGTPFYSSASKALYILNAAGNTLMDLAGNLSGSVFPYIIASGSFSGSFQGDGSGLTNISASSIVGLSLNSIQTGSVTASVDIGNISYQVVSSSNNLLTLENNGNFFVSRSLNINNDTSNISIGRDATKNITTGVENIGIGYTALLLTSTGDSNIGIGVSALRLNSEGDNNVAIGISAGDFSLSGSNNTFLGSFSNGQGYAANQNNNTFIGYQSGFTNIGNYNTFVGSEAGSSNTSGSYNTILGRGNLPLANQTNSLALFDGNNNIKLYSPSTHNIILGGTSDNGTDKLQVSGSIKSTLDAYINQVRVGKGPGDFNTNTIVGYQAFVSNSTGQYNVALGDNTLNSNTSGFENTAVGTQVLKNNTIGSNNTGLGENALYYNISGDTNTALGGFALERITSGSDNIGIGYRAGRSIGVGGSNTYSNNSIFIGSNTAPQNINQTNQIVIGHNAIGNGSNTVTIGDGNITKTYLQGGVEATSFTGSLFGTASYASQALSSSYSNTATSASYAFSATSASFATNALTASYVATASYIPNLQEVTDRGASTTNALTMSGAFINGATVISGDLDVKGTVTYISSSTLVIGDNIIEINANKAVGNSGMIVYDTTSPFTASLLWDVATDRWIAGPYGSESTIILASDTSSMSVNFARTSSYSTTLGASLSSPNPNQVRLLASDGSTLSTVTINNVTSASYALSASYAFNATSASYAFNATSASYSISSSYAANATSASYSFNATSASYALTSSYINPLIQNVVVTGSVTATTGFYDGTGVGFTQFAFLSSSKHLSYITPAVPGDLIQWDGTTMIASNIIDGGSF